MIKVLFPPSNEYLTPKIPVKTHRQKKPIPPIEIDASEVYYINEMIRNSVNLPDTFEPPIKTRLIKQYKLDGFNSYRINIMEKRSDGKQLGLYVWRSWYVEKHPDGYVFTPELDGAYTK